MTTPLDQLGLPSDVLVWQAVLLMIVSFGAGVLGGFVGLALGAIRLPAILLLGTASPTAAGTNIIVSMASAFTGAVRHLREGRVDTRAVLVMGVPSMAGAFVGGFWSERFPESLLVLAVGLLVFWQGVEFMFRARGLLGAGLDKGDRPWQQLTSQPAYLVDGWTIGGGVAGLTVGVLGGAVGLILGSLRLPALIRILRVGPQEAVGTNLVIGFAMGSMGWAGHVARGQVDYPLAVLMGATAMWGSYLGARMTGRVSADRLVMTMGLVLMGVGVLMAWRGLAA